MFGIAAIALIVIYSLVIAANQFWFLIIAACCALAIWLATLAVNAKRREDLHREEKLEEKEEQNT